MSEEIIILGILLSILFYELTDLSPGGVIVPGYLALFLDSPKRVIATFILSLSAYLIVRFISKYSILYGKRKFVVFIIITFILKYFSEFLSFGFLEKGMIIGVLIPGILAQDFDRNGLLKSLSAVTILTIFIKVIINLFYKGAFIGI